MDKPSGLEYLLNWLGLDWPDGDEDKMWDLADDWHDAAKSLSDIDGDIDAAISAVQAAYPEGSGGDAMIKQLQSMRSGPQSIDQLVSWFNHVGDSAQATGDSIEGGKIQFETLLLTTAAALLAEEAFPPTAPAEQAATIALSRVGARLAMRQLLKAIAENGLKDVLLTTLKNQWQRLLLHLVLDAAIPAGVNLANQEAKVQSGHQDGIHWGDVGKTAVVGLAGGLTGGFAGGLMQGWMRNLSSGMFKGLVSGITGGVTGTLASGLAEMAYTGKWEMDPSALVAGAFWGAHGSLGGHHGPIEDGTAPHTRVNLSDEGGVPNERPSVPSEGQDGSSPHVEPTENLTSDHSPSSEDSGPGQHSTDQPDATHPAGSEHRSESPEKQDHSTSTHDRPVDSRSSHETSSESGPKVHSTGSDGVRPESHAAESHPAQSHNIESRSEGTNVTSGIDHAGPRADNAARPESPVSARSGGSAGDGVRAPSSSPRPQATGDGSSAYRPTQSETIPVRSESTTTPAERPLAGSGESSETRPVSDSQTTDSVSADKPFSPSLDDPATQTPRTEDVPVSESRSPDDAEFVVPDDISTIHETPAPPEPSTRAGLADNTARPGDPERPSSRVGDRPEPSSPIRARSTGAEPGTRAGESTSRVTESLSGAGDSSRTDRTGSSDRPRELVGARARGDDETPHPNEKNPHGDNGTRPPHPPGEDPHSRAGLPEDPRAGKDGTHPSDRTPEEHRTGDHDDPVTRPADHEREEPRRDSTDDDHHEDGSPHPEEAGPTERPSIEDAFRDHAEPTDAGLSLHAKDPELSRLAGLVPADDHYFTVDAHVTADGHVRIGEHRYTPEEFGDMLREHGWDGEKPIRMIGCDASENGFVSRLANHLDTDVLAPTEKAWSDEHGRVYSSTPVKDANGNPRPRIPPDGEWHTTHPDGTTTPAGADGFVPGTPESAKHDLEQHHDPATMRAQDPKTITPSEARLYEPLTELTVDGRPVVVDENGVPHKIDGKQDNDASGAAHEYFNNQLERGGELYDPKTGNGSRFFFQDDKNPPVPKAIIDGTDSITGTTADLVKVTWRDGRVTEVETFDATTTTKSVEDHLEHQVNTLRNKLPDGSKYQTDNSVFVAPSEEWAHAVTEATGGDPRIRVIHPESGFDSAANAGESGARARSGSDDTSVGDGSAHAVRSSSAGDDSGGGRPVARGDGPEHDGPPKSGEFDAEPGTKHDQGHGDNADHVAPDGETPQRRAMRQQVERANNDPEYFKKYYKDHGNYTVRHSKETPDETGYVPPHLVKDPESGKWVAEDDAPPPLQPDYAKIHDPVGPEGVDRETLDTLNSSANDRQRAISEDTKAEGALRNARQALKNEDTPENREAVQNAEADHAPLHRDMSEKSEKFGETVAAEHAVPDHYEGAVPEQLEGPGNGNDQFDQVYKLPDGKYVVVECKSSVDTELGARWTRDGLRVSQGRREYFLDILEEMRERGEEYPHELDLADELEEALNNGDVDYILVQGQRNNGEYAGYVMKIFDISGRRAT
ncbi:hypothetical protein ACFYXQ_03030 [Nocardia jiangxiensis]|uniref:Outer membrane channel protein CpnT-like N-terminal domain-containing protein n=1 Tax=Nocardia jiangxiensis TaxID=282685 RepID=A0ABW6RRV3_9NOCA